jgi:predicted  nucleic acid-binding Zn-ribbon protein
LISFRAAIIVGDLWTDRMAWFLNFYRCVRCKRQWADQWSSQCEDDCPHCGARHMSPHDAEELTTLIEQEGSEFVVLWSPETAEHDPEYRQLGRFPSREKALEFLSADG